MLQFKSYKKMRKISLIIIAVILASCSNTPKEEKSNKDTVQAKPAASSAKLTPISNAVDTANSISAKKLMGIWMSNDSSEPTFQIKKSTIHYYRDAKTFAYKVLGDSLSIEYEDGPMKFSYKFKGSDTLIMNGMFGESILYRVK